MITIALMGILLGIAISTWQGVTDGRRVDSAANQFASDLRLAHTNSTNQLAEWRLVFRTNGNEVENCRGSRSADYCLVKVTDSGTEGTLRNFPDGAGISGTTIPADSSGGILDEVLGPLLGSSVEGTTTTIRFYADGSADTQVADDEEPRIAIGADNGAGSPREITLTEQTSGVKIG